ncbi:trihelix transcription factor GTL1 [Impatiens glandulifera]|uniref:trihelix transcription factor GTL1 n=1 Tax=Impatiens glandulifera TaxID=253017 RepID=UPI001FB0DDC9|nr:trihelix transcription factor GTL1 [Impatiens glandulifera]XP_047338677.1 trihelix transcription factor GTL1 [Impatiens glandulifera]
MEILIGDRTPVLPPPDIVVFPDQLTPFPDTEDILFESCGEFLPHSIESQSQPPQKLRPVRCNGRRWPEFTPAADTSGLVWRQSSCAEIGTENHETSLENIGSDVYSSALHNLKSVLDVEGSDIIGSSRPHEYEKSLSSDDDDNQSSEGTRETMLNRKRKRKSRKTIELFFRNMVNVVMHRQEQMHKQLIDLIEKRENERIIREDAWRKQQLEIAKREETIRAEETSRSLALISLIQNMLGNDNQVLKSSRGKINDQDYFNGEPEMWLDDEVQSLITVRTCLDHKFCNSPDDTISLWEEVAVGLSNMGYIKSAMKCKEKWDNINEYCY